MTTTLVLYAIREQELKQSKASLEQRLRASCFPAKV